MKNQLVAAALLVAACVANISQAQDLLPGSKAPKLQVKKFIKGEEVKGFAKGKIYVVEFWATWCGPCRTSIPHLTKLQKQYKDTTFIGVAVLEDEPDEVAEFVETMGDKMDYCVALDLVPEDANSNQGAMYKNWMEPAELRGIPAAFIVNGDGLIAWIGHPGEIDTPLEKITSGKWDIAVEAAKAKEVAAQKKKIEAVMTRLSKLYNEFEDSGDSEEILKALDAAGKEIPVRALQFTMIKFQILSSPKGDVDQALEIGDKLLESDDVGDNAQALNEIAWMLVSPDRDKKADPKLLKFALKAALKADNLAKNQDPSIADTLAKAYFDNGQLDKAVSTQERVLELIPGTALADDPNVKKRLRQYKRAVDAAKTENAPKK